MPENSILRSKVPIPLDEHDPTVPIPLDEYAPNVPIPLSPNLRDFDKLSVIGFVLARMIQHSFAEGKAQASAPNDGCKVKVID
jgi:hypothetical protein